MTIVPTVQDLNRWFNQAKSVTDAVTTLAAAQESSMSGVGNLSHSPKNDTRFDDLLALTEQLGAVHGQSEDGQVKHLLNVVQAAFGGVIDNVKDKHGSGQDDATVITERYWKARNQNVVFSPKAPNQRKTISCIRQCISLGASTNFGPQEPLSTVNKAMTIYQNLRKTPSYAGKLIDAANYLVLLARVVKRNKELPDDDNLRNLAMKPDPEAMTLADFLAAHREALMRLQKGKVRGIGAYTSKAVEDAVKALNRELKAQADAAREDTGEEEDHTATGLEIAAAADAQAAEEAKVEETKTGGGEKGGKRGKRGKHVTAPVTAPGDEVPPDFAAPLAGGATPTEADAALSVG